MTKVVPDVQLDPVLHRRRQLRYQRRLKLIQAGWRTLAIVGLTGGLVWATFLIEWVVYQPNQVLIKGNQLLATSAIQASLPLMLPQSLIRLQPKLITETLKSRVSVDQVTVTRQLFPPKLIVSVQEREPVAVVPGAGARLPPISVSPGVDMTNTSQEIVTWKGLEPVNRPMLVHSHNRNLGRLSSQISPKQAAEVWLLDSYGIITPLKSYPTLQQSGKLPQLTVLGILKPASASHKTRVPLEGSSTNRAATSTPEEAEATVTVDKQKQLQWTALYRVLEQSPVRIFEIDWQDKTNLILKTELGIVHTGPYSSKFADQLNVLDQLRGLPKHLNGKKVAYIDLKNPKKPLLQLNNPK